MVVLALTEYIPPKTIDEKRFLIIGKIEEKHWIDHT